MKWKKIIAIALVSSLLILAYGTYNIYQIFYPDYFCQTCYTQVVFKGPVPTKLEILFWGFRDLRVMLVCVLLGLFIVQSTVWIGRRRKSSYTGIRP